MANLETTYLGLKLKNPIIVGSSELTSSVGQIIELEKNGVGAVILKSLFEEQILMNIDAERVNNIHNTYSDTENYVSYYLKKNNVDNYLRLIKEAKSKVSIPVIASINCISSDEWTSFAKDIELAGADAIELNIFLLPADIDSKGNEIEKVYSEIILKVIQMVKIPVSVKLSSYFSGFANFVSAISKLGIKGITLFNRFYSPDIDIEKEKIISTHIYSNPIENSNVLRWVGILSNKIDCDIASSTGIHSGKDVIKNILVGADATQIVSTIYKNGTSHIKTMLDEIEAWMDNKSYKDLDSFRGKLSQDKAVKPMVYERAQFMKYFSDIK
ncbi:MAG: dihydroorotate dehydrogenase-like protein [Saprospiraceae bacterium]|nr:dihydroorotate dehydrogenase-like protein [Saprospiraceae bacterium]